MAEIFTAAQQLCRFLARPPRELFADVTALQPSVGKSAPGTPAAEFIAEAAAVLDTIGELLRQHNSLVKTVEPTEELAAVAALQGSVIIQELPNDDSEEQATDDTLQLEPAELALIFATYIEGPQQVSPWTSPATSAAAARALRSLQQSCAGSGTADAALLGWLPACTQRLQKHNVLPQQLQQETSELVTETGADTFERAIGGAQMLGLLHSLGKSVLADQFPNLLPIVLAFADDTSPAVQVYGIWGLYCLATEKPRAALKWQQELLLHEAQKVLVGCDASVWHAAAQMASAVACSVEGRDVFGPGYSMIMSALLTQGRQRGQKHGHRQVWIEACKRMLETMGLAIVAHFQRLLPLLIEWTDASDVETRIGAIEALHIIVSSTWPRIGQHSTLLADFLTVQSENARVKEEELAWEKLAEALKCAA